MPSDSITWCNEAGEIIGTGNPLEYEPMQDPEIVTAKVVDQFGCTNQTSVVLDSDSSVPDPDPLGPEIACINEEFQLTVDLGDDVNLADFTIQWLPEECIVSGGDTATPTVSSAETKTYTVIVTNIATGESKSEIVTVEIEDVEVGIFTDNGIPDQEGLPQVCQGSFISLSAAPFDDSCEYSWSTGENGDSIEVSPDENTSYTLSCTTANGCEFSSTADIEVLPPLCNEQDVFVPSAFSPNQDNVNDRLFVRSKFVQDMEFYVVDRWGEQVWRTTDIDEGWDGSFQGETLAPDTYAYCLKVTCVNNSTYTTSGNVTILK